MKKHTQYPASAEALLSSVQLRVTPQRTAILLVLMGAHEPISIDAIQERVQGKANYVTLYRVLRQFVEKGLVYQTDFRSGKSYYEFQHEGHHHHHITCMRCGVQEKTSDCHETHDGYAHVTRTSKKFVTITSHTLEFFGTCTHCDQS